MTCHLSRQKTLDVGGKVGGVPRGETQKYADSKYLGKIRDEREAKGWDTALTFSLILLVCKMHVESVPSSHIWYVVTDNTSIRFRLKTKEWKMDSLNLQGCQCQYW